MPLGEPPAPAAVTTLPSWRAAGQTLHRVFRRGRALPWWFASVDAAVSPYPQDRFDLPPPDGTCYLARTKVAAVLEAFQEHDGALPDVELRNRLRAEVVAPPQAPRAADLVVVAIEVKLTAVPDDDDVRRLRWLAHRIGNDLLDMVIITTGREAYRRADGVAVVPAALLGP